jgi:outer membrane protein assembly factor BamB
MSLSRKGRRGLAVAAVAAVLAAGAATAAPAGAAGADWPQAGASAAHRRWNAGESTLRKGNVSGLKHRWADGLPVGNPEGAVIPAEAIVANGRLFTLSVEGSWDTGFSTRLRASNPTTGALVWQRVLPGFTSGTPAVLDGRLFVNTTVIGTSADATTVYALQPSSGATLWSRPAGGEDASLAVEGNLVALLPTLSGGQTYTLRLLRATDGSVRGTFSGGDSDVVGIAGPTIRGGVTYFVGAGDGTPLPAWSPFFQAFTKSAATIAGWKSLKTSSGPASPAATGEGVYLPDKSGVTFHNLNTGAVKATMLPTAAEGHFRTPFNVAVDGDRVYLGYLNATTNVRTVTAFNRFTGARVWSKPIAIRADPAVANGVLYVAEGRNGVAAYNAATGAELWRQPGVANSAAPVVANGRLYVGWRPGADDTTPAPLAMFSL